MQRKRYLLVGGPITIILIAVAATLVLTGAVGPATNTPAAGIPATTDQRQEFSDLIQRYWHVFFHSWTTGDLSQFPTVFHNDPSETFNAHAQEELKRQTSKVSALLAKMPRRPGEAQTGMLSAQIADVLDRRESVQLWNAVQTKAASEGRKATLDDMPDGRIPVYAPDPDLKIDKQLFLIDARVNGNHASIIYVLDDPDSTLLYHLHLIQTEGNWYITNYWVTGNP